MHSSAPTDTEQLERLEAHGRRSEPRLIYDPELPKGAVARDALKVVQRLHRHGHKAYLVGGCVRDMLMGATPVDFDVVTSAELEEVRQLFRNSRIIGRRFPLALIYFKDHNLEVSTLRSGESTMDGVVASDLAALAPDSLAADTWFRDFTVNALVYDPIERVIFDYTDGLQDLERRCLRSIGDPGERFQSDPVRIVRGLRYAGRLELDIDPGTLAAMKECRDGLLAVPRRRLREEIWKVLHCRAVLRICQLMDEVGVLDLLIPELPGVEPGVRLAPSHPLWTCLYRLDHLEPARRSDPILLAVLFLPLVAELLEEEIDIHGVGLEILRDRLTLRLDSFASNHSMERRTRARARDLLLDQLRLLQGPDHGRHPQSFFRRKEAEEALTLYKLLRGEGDVAEPTSYALWVQRYREYQSGGLAPEKRRRRRRRRPRE